MKTKNVQVVFAFVDKQKNKLGICITHKSSDGFTGVLFVPQELWGDIPKDRIPEKELQDIANILNGVEINGDAMIQKREKPLILTIADDET